MAIRKEMITYDKYHLIDSRWVCTSCGKYIGQDSPTLAGGGLEKPWFAFCPYCGVDADHPGGSAPVIKVMK